MIPLLGFSLGPSLKPWNQGAGCSLSSQEGFSLTTATKKNKPKQPDCFISNHSSSAWSWYSHPDKLAYFVTAFHAVQHAPLRYGLTCTDHIPLHLESSDVSLSLPTCLSNSSCIFLFFPYSPFALQGSFPTLPHQLLFDHNNGTLAREKELLQNPH